MWCSHALFLHVCRTMIAACHPIVLFPLTHAHFPFTHRQESLAQLMMSKKTKRLYGRMQHGIEQKKEAVGRLETKRKAIEAASDAGGKGGGKGKGNVKGHAAAKGTSAGGKKAQAPQPPAKKTRR